MTLQHNARPAKASVIKFGTGLAAAVLLGLLAYFAWTTVYSSDDYWYSTFWDHGLSGYLELMDYHFQVFNGRVLVHVLAHILLCFDNWAFMIACCGLCLLAPVLCASVLGINRKRIPVLTAFFLMGILLAPRDIFNQGVMWISAACNYLFPAVLACVLAAALERHSRWAFVLSFLCGATTEQMGLAAAVLAAVYCIDALIRREGLVHRGLCCVSAFVGLWTIFLSPATENRAQSGVKMDSLAVLLETLCKNITREAALLTQGPAAVIVMLLFLLLAGIYLYQKQKLRCPIVVCAAGAAALVIGSVSEGMLCVAGFVAAFLALLLLAALLMVFGQRLTGALAVTGLASAAVMLITNTVEPRVMLPLYLLLLLCDCLLLAALELPWRRAAAACMAGTVVTVICLLPMIRGYWSNYQVDQRNKRHVQEVRDTDFLYYCTDYDMDYTWVKADFDPYFRFKYLESVGLPENFNVVFYSMSDQNGGIYCRRDLLYRRAVKAEDGAVYLPLREIVEHLGGTLDYLGTEMELSLDGIPCRIVIGSDSTLIVEWVAEDGSRQTLSTGYTRNNGDIYCETDLFTQVFGLQISHNTGNNFFTVE